MIGRIVAHYEIAKKLGEGGMGVVWKARDTHLNRFVALKLLPLERAADAERQRRFIQEAKAASALNHPNIVHIYDISVFEGLPYIAMEYVPGKTLGEHIGGKGLRLPDALKYAAQIADAMGKAHAAGIIHRDLKPSNIMVTDEGLVKVVDFGLAKLAERSVGDETAATQTLDAMETPCTQEGIVVGTIAYLSPEQVEGKPIDARSDIFAFGTVLYEMATGVKPFRRGSPASTMAAILNEEPKPPHEFAPAIPPEFERLIARCLRKDPERRLRSMSDLSLALQELKEESESGRLAASTKVEAHRPSHRGLIWGSALAAVLVCAAIVWFGRRNQPQPEASVKTSPLTTYPGIEKSPSFSPDGSQVAFSWNGETQKNFDIYVKSIGPGPPLRLTTDPADDIAPAWAPDGSSIAFLRSQGTGKFSLLLMPALGGPEHKLADVSLVTDVWIHGPYLSWLPDSQSIVFTDMPGGKAPAGLFVVSIRTGERPQLTFPPSVGMGDSCVAVSPNGTLAFCRAGTLGEWSWDIYLLVIGNDGVPHGELRQVTFDHRWVTGIAWASDSSRLVYSSGSLWTLPVSGASGASGARSTKLTFGEEGDWPAISRTSNRLAYSRGFGGDTDIWRLRIARPGDTPEPPTRLIASTWNEFAQQYSPDGKRIAFESNRTGNLEIWTCDSEGQSCTQLTWIGSTFTGVPAWSPDSRQVAFYSRVEGKSQVFVIGADGGAPRRLTLDNSNNFYPRWSRDGQWIHFASNRTGVYQVWKVPPTGGTAAQVTRKGGFAASGSPDGKWLYYTKNESSDAGLWRMPVAGGEEAQVIEAVTLHNYAVVNDGVYFIANSAQGLALQFLSNATSTTRVVAPVRKGYVGLSVSPDGKWILYTESNPTGSDLFLVENIPIR